MVALFHHKNLLQIKKKYTSLQCLVKTASPKQFTSTHFVQMGLFLTCLRGRRGVLRKASTSPASFSNLTAIWCGCTAPRGRGAEPLTCLTHAGCPSVSPSYRRALERRRSSRGFPLGCPPVDTAEYPRSLKTEREAGRWDLCCLGQQQEHPGWH